MQTQKPQNPINLSFDIKHLPVAEALFYLPSHVPVSLTPPRDSPALLQLPWMQSLI